MKLKQVIQDIRQYFAADRKRILWIILWLLLGLIGLSMAIASIPVAIGLALIALIVFKLVTGFPSVFGTLLQLVAVLMICFCSLVLVYRSDSKIPDLEKRTRLSEIAGSVKDQMFFPEAFSSWLTTSDAAWAGVGIGLLLGAIGEVTSGLTALAMTGIRMGDKLDSIVNKIDKLKKE